MKKIKFKKRMNDKERTIAESEGYKYKDFALEKLLRYWNITHIRTGVCVNYGFNKREECIEYLESEQFKARFNEVVEKMEDQCLFDEYKEELA